MSKKLSVNDFNFEQLIQLAEQSGKPVGYELNRILGKHFYESNKETARHDRNSHGKQ